MDELIDIVTPQGIPTGEIVLKSTAHQQGILHASVHVWLYTTDGNVLIQQRKHNKDTFPNLWDVSVAGHIAAGETPLNTAIRETQEEIGCILSLPTLNHIGFWESNILHKPTFIDHEIHHIYLAPLSCSLDTLTPQESEVANLTLISITDLTKPSENIRLVPRPKAYYEFISKKIQEKLNKATF